MMPGNGNLRSAVLAATLRPFVRSFPRQGPLSGSRVIASTASTAPLPAAVGSLRSPGNESSAPLWMWIIPCLWAGAFLTGAAALQRLSADTVSFLRFAVTVVFGLVLLWRPIRATLAARLTSAQWGAILLLATFGGVLYHVAFYYGLARSAPPIASVVIAMNPILTTIAAAIVMRHRRPTAILFIGLAFAFAGVLALAADKTRAIGAADASMWERILSGWGEGETFCLIAACAWSVYALLLQRFREGVLAGLPSAGVTYLTYAVTAAMLLPVVIATGGVAEIPTMDTREWGCVLYIGVLSTVVAYTMYNVVLDRIGAARTSQLTYVVPALTTLLTVVLLHTFEPTWRTALGIVLVTTGLVVSDGRFARAFLARFTSAAQRTR